MPLQQLSEEFGLSAETRVLKAFDRIREGDQPGFGSPVQNPEKARDRKSPLQSQSAGFPLIEENKIGS